MSGLRRRLAPILGTLLQLSDWRSRRLILASKLRRRSPSRSSTDAGAEVRVRGIGIVTIRPRTTDESLIYGHLRLGQHRPLEPVAGWDLRQICELGTNIGLGLADLGTRYPQARLLGVEADPDNAALARVNLARFGGRCTLVEAAVWETSGNLELAGDRPGLMEVGRSTRGDAEKAHTVRAITISELLEAQMPEGTVDYMHFDIVGAEPHVLTKQSAWAKRVRSLKIQLYDDRGFRPADCVDLLRALGFEAHADHGPYGDLVFGVRRA
jgi:FkbM family methyltransferase